MEDDIRESRVPSLQGNIGSTSPVTLFIAIEEMTTWRRGMWYTLVRRWFFQVLYLR
jgi:hypothetical protein